MKQQDPRAAAAWRSAVVAVSLNMLGMALEAANIYLAGLPPVPALVSMGVGGALLYVLLVRRPTASVALGNAVFLLNAVAIVCALWVIDRGHAPTWEAFEPQKLGMVTVALLAAEPWVGGIGIALYALAALAQFAGLPGPVRQALSVSEPLATVAFAVFAAILLAYRVKAAKLERDFAITRTKVEATEHLARVLVAVRDLTNTPLQTIAFAAQVARDRHPDLSQLMDRVESSLGKLRALERRLPNLNLSCDEAAAGSPETAASATNAMQLTSRMDMSKK